MNRSRSSSNESSMLTARRIQFGRPPTESSSSSSSKSEEEEEEEQKPSPSEEIENVNLRLRHQMPSLRARVIQTKFLDDVSTMVCIAVLNQCLNELAVLRQMSGMSIDTVSTEFVPLLEKYSNAEHEIDVIVNTGEEFLVYKKFRNDISWLERVLKTTVDDLSKTYYFEILEQILRDEELNRDEEETLLSSREFNRRELLKLRTFIDEERAELMREIQDLTEEIGNATDQLNDSIAESYVKTKYVRQWQKSRMEQNTLLLEQKEESYMRTSRKKQVAAQNENRVHEELWAYLNVSMEECQAEIEKWMDKYDADLDEKDKQVQELKNKIERQRDRYDLLQTEYNERQQKIEHYKAHKLKKQKEAEKQKKLNDAATKIQSWWRGVMFRKGLGPFRKKKGKGKKGGNDTNSAIKKKK